MADERRGRGRKASPRPQSLKKRPSGARRPAAKAVCLKICLDITTIETSKYYSVQWPGEPPRVEVHITNATFTPGGGGLLAVHEFEERVAVKAEPPSPPDPYEGMLERLGYEVEEF